MKSHAQNSMGGRLCLVCGAELPPMAAPNRCPRCLLRAGLESEPAGEEITVANPRPAAVGVFPNPGDLFGHYRVTCWLGEGGMGAAFEAEDLQSDRRVALKVLGHRLDSPEARRRFLREGRLAASVNHPNSVYVFGTEEIAGVPVIAMELMTGGNLQELVASQGPLEISQAVDCLLQIIAGLEAAHQAGILHRDIKPSNCFLTGDGTVKIGDFGLSISKALRHDPPMTVSGVFLGTPAFASPEQLRGDELTVRSDIYSVGVTLYYLLTGRYPFQGGDLVRLLATVLEQKAESPRKWRADLPAGLERVVLQCLAKHPDQRFPNYEALRAALLPFASIRLTPAALGLRFLAGCIDALVLMVPEVAVNYLTFGPFIGGVNDGQNDQPVSLAVWVGTYGIALAYYGLLEGCWGASIGKALCGLRVVRLDRALPGVLRAMGRALIFLTPALGVRWVQRQIFQVWAATPFINLLVFAFFTPLVILVLRFSTARRHNQFGGLHDLASGTRVLTKSAYLSRPVQPLPENVPAQLEASPRIGPYYVLDRIGGVPGEELFLGFDAQLLRRVWIRKTSPDTPPLSPVRRMGGRPGGLRWLQGKRAGDEAWDVYEAVPGRPLLSLLAHPLSWSQVRCWLYDLAEEMSLAAKDGTLPQELDLDRIWITAHGRAKLLEFPVPGVEPVRNSPVSTGFVSPLVFLQQVAISLLEGRVARQEESQGAEAKAPMACHARQFLKFLSSGAGLEDVLQKLKPLLNLTAEVSRAQRLVLQASTWLLALPVLALSTVTFGYGLQAGILTASPDIAILRHCLLRWEELRRIELTTPSEELEERRAIETYIAGKLAPLINRVSPWRRTYLVIPDQLWMETKRILMVKPAPSEEQIAWAEARVQPRLEPLLKTPGSAARMAREGGLPLVLWFLGGYLSVVLLLVLPCVAGSVLFRGGLVVRMWGIHFVTGHGTWAPRWRVLARNVLAWLPFLLLLPAWFWLSPRWGGNTAVLVSISLSVALVALSGLLPQRSWPDRVTGLWPVPR